VPAGAAATPPLSATDSGARNSGSSRAHAALPRSMSDSTQPAANIGQMSCVRYMVNAVSCPMEISPCQTSAPPTPSVSAPAAVSVRPTAGS
jgi:hypothetical protein